MFFTFVWIKFTFVCKDLIINVKICLKKLHNLGIFYNCFVYLFLKFLNLIGVSSENVKLNVKYCIKVLTKLHIILYCGQKAAVFEAVASTTRVTNIINNNLKHLQL